MLAPNPDYLPPRRSALPSSLPLFASYLLVMVGLCLAIGVELIGLARHIGALLP